MFVIYLETYLTDEHDLEAIRRVGFYVGYPGFLGVILMASLIDMEAAK